MEYKELDGCGSTKLRPRNNRDKEEAISTLLARET